MSHFGLEFGEEAYNRFFQDQNRITFDDCGVVLKYIPNEEIYVVTGDEQNFKITHQQDLYLADNFIKDGLLASNAPLEKNIEDQLSDKVVVIFGGSSGIGESLVCQCRDMGANVYSFSRRNGCDITNHDEIVKSLELVKKNEGRIDYVINTVGILIKKPISFVSDEDVFNNCAVNYSGAINIARTSYEYLKDSRGMLINFTSSSFTRGRAGYSLYSSSKAAVVNLTQALSEEWLSADIKVNCINPERTDTPMRRKNFGIEPPESLLTAQHVANKTLSVMASNCTGQIVLIKK